MQLEQRHWFGWQERELGIVGILGIFRIERLVRLLGIERIVIAADVRVAFAQRSVHGRPEEGLVVLPARSGHRQDV